jgi:hypothetical protein
MMAQALAIRVLTLIDLAVSCSGHHGIEEVGVLAAHAL